jgi:DNA-binding GntR family transcriptional regulator
MSTRELADIGRAGGERRETEPMADRAYAELRDQIVSLRIPPGAPIIEDALGRELDMGRTPIREAIKRLALENLVTVFPRRGTFASEINITDLTAISDVRVQLEGHAAYRAAERLTAAGVDELDQLRVSLAACRDTDDAATLMALDANVHRFIHRAAANPYLEETLARYFNLSLRIWYLVLERLPHLGARVHEHVDLLMAIRARDPERSRAIMAEHVATFEDEIRTVL